MKIRDAIIGSITNYTIDQIKPWVESLEQCGVEADRFMVCYNIDYSTVDYLTSKNFRLKLFNDIPQQQRYTHIPDQNFHIIEMIFFIIDKSIAFLSISYATPCHDYRFS